MNGQRVARQSTGWGTVVMVALLGLALAAAVVLTPWRIGEPPTAGPGNSAPNSSVNDAERPTGPVLRVRP